MFPLTVPTALNVPPASLNLMASTSTRSELPGDEVSIFHVTRLSFRTAIDFAETAPAMKKPSCPLPREGFEHQNTGQNRECGEMVSEILLGKRDVFDPATSRVSETSSILSSRLNFTCWVRVLAVG